MRALPYWVWHSRPARCRPVSCPAPPGSRPTSSVRSPAPNRAARWMTPPCSSAAMRCASSSTMPQAGTTRWCCPPIAPRVGWRTGAATCCRCRWAAGRCAPILRNPARGKACSRTASRRATASTQCAVRGSGATGCPTPPARAGHGRAGCGWTRKPGSSSPTRATRAWGGGARWQVRSVQYGPLPDALFKPPAAVEQSAQ